MADKSYRRSRHCKLDTDRSDGGGKTCPISGLARRYPSYSDCDVPHRLPVRIRMTAQLAAGNRRVKANTLARLDIWTRTRMACGADLHPLQLSQLSDGIRCAAPVRQSFPLASLRKARGEQQCAPELFLGGVKLFLLFACPYISQHPSRLIAQLRRHTIARFNHVAFPDTLHS